MLDTRIEFDEKYDNEEYGTTTLYFTAPRELLSAKYPEAVSTEISVEFPISHPEPASENSKTGAGARKNKSRPAAWMQDYLLLWALRQAGRKHKD